MEFWLLLLWILRNKNKEQIDVTSGSLGVSEIENSQDHLLVEGEGEDVRKDTGMLLVD